METLFVKGAPAQKKKKNYRRDCFVFGQNTNPIKRSYRDRALLIVD